MIDADAMDKAAEKVAAGTDYYSDMTDEERAEEDLPAREAPKPEEKPATVAPADDPAPKPDVEEEAPEQTDTEAADRLLQEVRDLGAKLDSAIGEKPPKTEAKRDEVIDAALEHEDPVVRGLAERLQETKKELDALKGAERARIYAAQEAKDNADFAAVMKTYLIDGKPMVKEHREQIEDYLYENEEAGAVLTIEEATLRVFPKAVKGGPKSPPARGPGDSRQDSRLPVATIVDQGSTGAAPQGKWEPRPNETIDSAVAAFGKSKGWAP